MKEIEGDEGAAENIDRIGFSRNGILTDEFLRPYPALFENAENHLAIIRALAKKWKGLSRKEIIDISRLPDGGSTTGVLEELLSSGFISQYFPFGKRKKETLYRLTD